MTNRPAINPVESLRNTRRSFGDGTLQGRSRIATPFRPDRLRAAARGVSSTTSIPLGEYLALTGETTTGAAFLSGLDTIQSQSGFDAVTAASDTLKLPLTGEWLLELDTRFTDGYRGGATVQVTLNGSPIEEAWPTWTNEEPWNHWVDQVAFVGERNDTVELTVTAADAQSHTMDATFRLAYVERVRPTAEDIPLLAPEEANPTDYRQADSGVANGTYTTASPEFRVPSGVQEGEMLIGIFHGMTHIGNGQTTPVDITFPAEWTAIYTTPTLRTGQCSIMYKFADADDAARTSRYTITTESGVNANHTHSGHIMRIAAGRFGGTGVTPTFDVNSDTDTTSGNVSLEVAEPTGDWVFAVVGNWSTSSLQDGAVTFDSTIDPELTYTGISTSRLITARSGVATSFPVQATSNDRASHFLVAIGIS